MMYLDFKGKYQMKKTFSVQERIEIICYSNRKLGTGTYYSLGTVRNTR